MRHLDADTLMRQIDGLLADEAAEQVARHLAECQECRERRASVQAFATRLNTQWLGSRLRSVIPEEIGCPPPHELSRYFLGELDTADREQLQTHLDDCPRCRETISEMEEGFAALQKTDPLGARERVPTQSWVERLQAALGLMPWPGWAGATVAVCLAFLAGLLLRPMFSGPPEVPPGVEAIHVAKPAFLPRGELPALGIAPAVKPEAEKAFREAMAFYDAPDFPEKAIPKLKEAVSVDPGHDRAQFWLGIAYLLKEETTAAILPLKEAVRLAPGNREYKQYLVWAYLKIGATEKAFRLQTEVLQRR